MATIHEFDTTVIDLSIDRAVQTVMRTMVGRSARFIPHQMDPTNWTVTFGQLHVSGTIGVEGTINGAVHVYFSLPLAELSASRVLRLPVQKVSGGGEKLVNDVVAELTNMTIGVFKNQLVELGLPCRLTLPTVRRGKELKLDPAPDALRRLYAFDVAGHRLIADVILGGA